MISIKTILVPYDFSSFAQYALSYGIDLARATGAELHVLHVELLHGVLLEAADEGPSRAEALRKKMEAETVLGDSTVRDVVIHYAVGRDVAAAPSILQYVDTYNIDLIIAGTHGRRGIRRAFLGSVAEEVVRLSSCPVLTVHGPTTPAFGGIRRVLAPVDFSDHSRESLRYAIELARLTDAGLDILHVIQETSRPVLYDAGVISFYKLRADIESRALAQMKDLYVGLDGPAGKASYHVRQGHPAEEIDRFARDEASGMIVMGTHGLTGLSHLLMGSITEKVVRLASCPVFTVKSFSRSILESEPEFDESAAASH